MQHIPLIELTQKLNPEEIPAFLTQWVIPSEWDSLSLTSEGTYIVKALLASVPVTIEVTPEMISTLVYAC